MKTRNGFVSNSSSSSFVVGFKKDQLPKNAEEMRKLLYGELKEVGEWGEFISTERLAKRVWEDFEKQEPATPEVIMENLCSRDYLDLDYDDFKTEDDRIDFDAYHLEQEILANKETERIIKENPNLVFYVFSYSDGDGSFCSNLEHCGTFDKLFNIRISHH